jgi:uncharacterized protein YifE (UPF0438 family)
MTKENENMPHLTTWPPDLGDPKEKFHVKPSFKFTRMILTGPEKRLLRRCGTRLQAFEEGRSISSSDEYKHFMEVCERNAEPITEEERVWLKYRTMLEDEKRLREQHRKELINSRERDEYIKSRFVP